jgi:hypothetical protein
MEKDRNPSLADSRVSEAHKDELIQGHAARWEDDIPTSRLRYRWGIRFSHLLEPPAH